MDKAKIGSLWSLRHNALLGLHSVKGSRTVSDRSAVSVLFYAVEAPPRCSPDGDSLPQRALTHLYIRPEASINIIECPCRTQQTNNNLEDASDRFSLHADLPFLQQSHHRIWYIWLVISFVGKALSPSDLLLRPLAASQWHGQDPYCSIDFCCYS